MPGPETRDALARALERLGQGPDNHDLRLHTADLAIAVAVRQQQTPARRGPLLFPDCLRPSVPLSPES